MSIFLHVEILDQANESKFAQTRKFFVSNPVMDLTRAGSRIFYVNNYTTMQEDEAERALIRIRHVEDVTAFISIDEQPELIGGLIRLQSKVEYPQSARRARI